MRSPTISAGIIPYFQKDWAYYFLCVKHQRWHRGFPKWGIKEHESETEAATREFREETWIREIKINDKAKFMDHFPITNDGKQIEKTVTFFLGEISESELTDIHLQESEMANYKVWTYEEILETLTFDSAKQILREAFTFLTK